MNVGNLSNGDPKLVFTTLPSLSGNADTVLSKQPTVTIQDAFNHPVRTYRGNINLAGYSDSTCTTLVASSIRQSTSNNQSGAVVFSGVKIIKTSVISIKATDGTLNSPCLTGFTISPGALDSIEFGTPPFSAAFSGINFNSQPVIMAVDANQNAMGAGTVIALNLTSGTPVFSCATNPLLTDAFGLATFSGCKLTGTPGSYTLTGASSGKIALSKTINLTLPPLLGWNTLTNDFGSLTIGNYSSYVSFMLFNTGSGAAISCSAPTLSNSTDFTIFSDACGTSDLAPGASCVVNIRANPRNVEIKTATLNRSCTIGGVVSTSANGLTTIGSGTLSVAWNQANYDFGNVRASSQSNSTTLYFQNLSVITATGCTAILISNPTDFTILSDTCGSSNLNPFDQCSIQVKANPTTIGAKIATISRTCSGTTSSISLTATGLSSGVTVTNVVSSEAADHNCALMSDGSVQCWGYNTLGQIGDGTTINKSFPTLVAGLSGTVTALAAGGGITCALISGGTVQCWGWNFYGQGGDGTTTSRSSPTSVTGLSGVVTALTAGFRHTCALISGGTAQCWGYNGAGQLGDGTITQRNTATLVTGLSGAVISLSGGGNHTCALISGGTVQCFGSNSNGQLGDGTTTDRAAPTSVPGLAGVIALSTGSSHTCALISGGTLKCWGYNGYGQIGDGSTSDKFSPTSVGGLSGSVTALTSGLNHTCALISGGTIQCWGFNRYGQLGDNSATDRAAPTAVPGMSGTVTAITGGNYHSCAMISGGTVQCWGRNNYGQLGSNAITSKVTPTLVTGLSGVVTTITTGSNFTCALISDGSVQCWGYNSYGQLGDGTTTYRNTPTSVIGLSGVVTAITAGASYTCALISGGTVQCWGYNSYGQRGDGTTTNKNSPTSVIGLTGVVTDLIAESDTTCALISGGTVQCWGYNGYGQIGDGTTVQRNTPTLVNSLAGPVSALTAGGNHNCALISDGTMQCWGYNWNGQIGDGTITNRKTPTSVTTLSGIVTSITAGGNHTCALISDGTMQCWGSNTSGQLGDGTTTNRATPNLVTNLFGTGTSLSAGSNYTCAKILGGTAVQCWGDNSYGQLGNGTLTSQNYPKTIPGQFSINGVYSSNQASHTCILKSGTPYCFGANGVYQSYNSLSKSTVSGF